MTDVQRDIGALEARADAQEKRLARIEAKLDQVVETLAQNKGGIRMLLAVGSVAAAIGSGITKLWDHMS